MTKKQAVVCFLHEGARTRSFHHEVLILVVSIIFCHQSAIDAFCIDSNHRHCGGRKSHRKFYQRPRQFQYSLSTPAVVSSTATPTKNSQLSGFFGGIFGGGDDEKEALLATYDIEQFDGNDVDVKFESLSDYITNKWAMLFVTGNIPLTTPVRVLKNAASSEIESNQTDQDENSGAENVEDVAGCRLIFQKVDTSYKSKEEEEAGSTTVDDRTTSSDQEETKQGGVEILVEKISKLSPSSDDARRSLRIRARRCEVDDDTMIKEMSEDIIVEELRKAIDIWKKERV